MRNKWVVRRVIVFLSLWALPVLAACNSDQSQVFDGDNPAAIIKLQACVNSGGTPIMHSADGGLYIYCIHKSGR